MANNTQNYYLFLLRPSSSMLQKYLTLDKVKNQFKIKSNQF
jgi:hypothetical protein